QGRRAFPSFRWPATPSAHCAPRRKSAASATAHLSGTDKTPAHARHYPQLKLPDAWLRASSNTRLNLNGGGVVRGVVRRLLRACQTLERQATALRQAGLNERAMR